MPTKVAIVMPNTTAVPMTPRDAAPEPFASINGTQPRMNAKEVITGEEDAKKARAEFDQRADAVAADWPKLVHVSNVIVPVRG